MLIVAKKKLIHNADGNIRNLASSNHHYHMVTYEDGDGDWMLIGDLPWE
jgi:AUX/IAA family